MHAVAGADRTVLVCQLIDVGTDRPSSEKPSTEQDRAWLSSRLDELLRSRSAPSHRPDLALAVLELDDLAAVQDRFGFAAAEALIDAVRQRLRASLRDTDLVARLSADAVGVILTGVPDAGIAEQLIARLVRQLSFPFPLDVATVECSASAGVVFVDQPHADPDALLQQAAVSANAARRDGPGSTRSYTVGLGSQRREEARVEHRLRTALGSHGIGVHYQPIHDLASGQPVAVEALARLEDASGAPIAPAVFLPVAERIGLVATIDTQVLARAAAQVADWNDGRARPLRLAVNVSPLHLRADDIATRLTGIVSAAGLPADLVDIEIAESALHPDARARTRLEELVSVGFGLSIDNFGSGHASLHVLQQWPVSRLKIDRSFVGSIDDPGSRAPAIVQALIDLGNRLGIAVAAEGVERPAQRDLLARWGFAWAQGYLLHPPASAADVRPAVVDQSVEEESMRPSRSAQV